ncbi:TPA: hypothetical protein ACPIAX_003999 [Pseudomonas aeruginosa]|jgi:MoaA/NifB/PqqE/SkfB family radical SAM enzyme|nr:hypothetical protein [Pseudomonas sp. NFPP33]
MLSRKLPVLLAAGIKRINISLDPLDALAFRRIARVGELTEVLTGIDQALAAGLQVKINMGACSRLINFGRVCAPKCAQSSHSPSGYDCPSCTPRATIRGRSD